MPEWIVQIVLRNDIQCSNICLEQDCAAIYYEMDSNICYLGVLVDKCKQVESGIKVLTRNGKIPGIFINQGGGQSKMLSASYI